MNCTKNGIPRDFRPNANHGKPYRATVNPYKHYVTLKRVEEGADVWLVMPFDKTQVDELIVDRWRVVELWVSK